MHSTTSTPSTFGNLPLSPELLTVIEELGFAHPTQIQALTLPILLDGKDVVARSRTGSGKTTAFALPILQKLSLAKAELQALILCPTRELSVQVAREFRVLGRRAHGLNVAVLTGGEPTSDQSRRLKGGVHVAVGTPGRILDHLRRENLHLERIETVVLDEADRMLDMGFFDDVSQIIRHLPTRRQTVLFSATIPESVEALSRAVQSSPVTVGFDTNDHLETRIEQLAIGVESAKKVDKLVEILARANPESVIVFVNQIQTAIELTARLAHERWSVEALHGELEQSVRTRILSKFRNRSTRVLVATDIAARGIHLEKLDWVINFDLPVQAETYIHRIGRTGRGQSLGRAVSIFVDAERAKLDAISLLTQCPLRYVDSVDATVERGEASKTSTRSAPMTTLVISGGRKDKLRAGDILGALTSDGTPITGENVGKIEIFDRFAYVAVARGLGETALFALRNGRIKGKRFKISMV